MIGMWGTWTTWNFPRRMSIDKRLGRELPSRGKEVKNNKHLFSLLEPTGDSPDFSAEVQIVSPSLQKLPPQMLTQMYAIQTFILPPFAMGNSDHHPSSSSATATTAEKSIARPYKCPYALCGRSFSRLEHQVRPLTP